MGLATIQAQTTFNFRVDPEAITFSYKLNTFEEDTYGGKVIQLLSTSVSAMTVPCLGGGGGRAYVVGAMNFFKDMLIWQRNTGNIAIFNYAPRGYNLHVYAASISWADKTGNVTYPFTMNFNVSEDAGGHVSGAIMQATIDKLIDGVGYTKNQYNDPTKNTPNPVPAFDPNAGAGPAAGGGAGGAAGGLFGSGEGTGGIGGLGGIAGQIPR